MLSLAERVYRTVQRHSLLPPGARVVVALSGGADSTALACLLADLAPRGGFHLVAAAHFNHRLRGAAADEDEAFCREFAARLGLRWEVGAADVGDLAVRHHLSIEEASRRYRYRFLGAAAARLGATHLAAGHTRDDQAETLLLNLFRGAGPAGLRAMAPVRDVEADTGWEAAWPESRPQRPLQLVRPLLEVGHEDLVRWLKERSIAFREDASNLDLRFRRNRVRHRVLPFLEQEVSGAVSRVLARDAAIAAADAEYLETLASEAFDRAATVGPPGRVALDRAHLAAAPRALARRVALRALRNIGARRFVGFDQADRVVDVARGVLAAPAALPGALVTLEGDCVVVARAAPRRPRGSGDGTETAGMNFLPQELSIPGEASLPGTEWTVSSSLRPREWADADRLRHTPPGEARVDAARAVGLAVRRRRPGDWLRPLGLGGRKKLQDYLVDRKVPKEQRDRLPLVVDARDRIVWVAGHGIDEEFRVSAGTRDVVILKLRGEIA